MAQRFNAPPGWNVPPDFVPTSDWQPDPSWPPAPEGWNYWVDDAAQSAPAYGTPSSPAYGTASNQPYGAPADQGTTPYGSASVPSSPYTAPAGAYGSTAPGSASIVMAEQQYANAKKSLLIGGGLLVVGILVNVWLLNQTGRQWWWLPLIGIFLLIRGLVDLNKAKKAQAAQLGYGQGSAPPGFTPPGTTPPGQNPPGY